MEKRNKKSRIVLKGKDIMPTHIEERTITPFVLMCTWWGMTIARGKIIVDNGKYLGSSGDGKYLKLKLNPEVLNHPIV